MFEMIKMSDMKIIHQQKKGLYTFYRIYFKEGTGKKKNFPVLLQWTTYLRAWALHTTPETSLVNLFANQGFDVYLVDWGDDSYFMEKGSSFADYIQGALDIFDFVLQDSKKDRIHYFGLCEGSIMAQIVASLRAPYIKTLSFNDLILNSDNMGVTNLFMDEYMVPMTDNPFTRFFAQFINIPPVMNESFLLNTLYSPIGSYLMSKQQLKKSSYSEYFWREVWAWLDAREIQFSHHVDYAKAVYANEIFEGKFKFKSPSTGKTEKVNLKEIKAPIYNIIGAMDNLTEAAGSMVEKDKNPFGTLFEDIVQDVIPTGHNFWLISSKSDTDNVRKKWLEWVIENDKM